MSEGKRTSSTRKRYTSTPHDLIFKQFLTDPAVAKDFMRLYLPVELQSYCDFNSIKLESGSFVEESLRSYISDILYSLKTTTGDAYVYVLIEHQSTPDKHMAFRLLRYAVAAMQRHLDAGHTTLPLVIPILFYAGKRSPYPYSTRWLDGFSSPEIAEKIYNQAFPLTDITIIPDDEIMNHRSMAALTLLQKHIRQRDLIDLLDQLTPLFLTEHMTRQQFISLINYLLQVGETSDAEKFVHQLVQRVPLHEDDLMTIAEQLEQKGLKKGIEQGIEQGIVKGLAAGGRAATLKIAHAMLKNGIQRDIVISITGLTEDDLNKISG